MRKMQLVLALSQPRPDTYDSFPQSSASCRYSISSGYSSGCDASQKRRTRRCSGVVVLMVAVSGNTMVSKVTKEFVVLGGKRLRVSGKHTWERSLRPFRMPESGQSQLRAMSEEDKSAQISWRRIPSIDTVFPS